MKKLAKMAPGKDNVVDAKAWMEACKKYDVHFLVKVCIKLLEKPLGNIRI